jgi:hypothetical protein
MGTGDWTGATTKGLTAAAEVAWRNKRSAEAQEGDFRERNCVEEERLEGDGPGALTASTRGAFPSIGAWLDSRIKGGSSDEARRFDDPEERMRRLQNARRMINGCQLAPPDLGFWGARS